MLLSPNDCMGECVEKFKSGDEVFYDLRHQTIFTVLAEMYDRREAIDVITLQQRLKMASTARAELQMAGRAI